MKANNYGFFAFALCALLLCICTVAGTAVDAVWRRMQESMAIGTIIVIGLVGLPQSIPETQPHSILRVWLSWLFPAASLSIP